MKYAVTQREICVTAYAEVEGGYGCAVELTTFYECSLQDTCRLYKESLCSLNK